MKKEYNVNCLVYKYHIIYKTTNTVNNKIYVGLHSTDNINDGYLGSGWVLKDAIKKYGRDKFTREVLYTFSSRKEARIKEAEIVDTEFCKRLDTYNLTEGGFGVEPRRGKDSPSWGKLPGNAKKVKATHKDGTVIIASSIQELSTHIHIDRANIRNLLKKGIYGYRGWKVTPA